MSSAAHEDAAARWLVKRESGNWSQDDESGFNAWLTASTANRIAYLRVKATWDGAARLKRLQPNLNSETVPPRGSWATELTQSTPSTLVREETPAPPQLVAAKRARVFGALAAACAVVAISVYALTTGVFAGRHYATPVGGIETVALHDGSQVTLNTNSAIRSEFGPSERRIGLDSGEIFLDVAKDANRPFVVQAGNTRVTAVGTQFSVRRQDDVIQVVVIEGTVRMESKPRTPLPTLGSTFDPVLVRAGKVASLENGRPVIRAQDDREAERLLSWRNGYVRFENATLAAAVAEFNRYTTRTIVIEDPSIEAIRLSGNFRINNVDAFLALLQDGFNVSIQQNATGIALQAK